MGGTTIRRTAQLIQDLKTLKILKAEDSIRCVLDNSLDSIAIEVSFADKGVNDSHGYYKLTKLAFEKEFGSKNIDFVPNDNLTIRIEISL